MYLLCWMTMEQYFIHILKLFIWNIKVDTLLAFNMLSIYNSAVKRLIINNCIKNKSICLHYICVCTMYVFMYI